MKVFIFLFFKFFILFVWKGSYDFELLENEGFYYVKFCNMVLLLLLIMYGLVDFIYEIVIFCLGGVLNCKLFYWNMFIVDLEFVNIRYWFFKNLKYFILMGLFVLIFWSRVNEFEFYL